MIVGYARTSTLLQEAGYEAQKRELTGFGCEKIFAEQISATTKHRPQLEAALDFVREGDVFVVAKIDRLARSMTDLMRIVDMLEAKKVALRIVNISLDTGSPTGRLTLHILGSVAQFERGMMLERQREGIEKAKAAGKFKGRPPTLHKIADQVHALTAEGKGPAAVARELGIGRSSVYRILESNGAA